jgi:hypothetical protein
MPKRPHFVPINRRALLARMARALKKQARELRSVRHKGQTSFVLIDARKEAIVEIDVDLEKLARELGVLKSWEKLAKVS